MADVNKNLRNNLFSFRDTFRNYTDCYTVIGGTACFILMEDAGLNFRSTNDIDMILIFEDKTEEFAKIFWDYIVAGGYTCGWKKSESHYYRFTDPNPGYPSQIELFSKRENFSVDSRIIPVHISDDISSLSAIALDDDFYDFMMKGRTVVNDISVLGPEYIIPFKMFAWVNNRDLKEKGEFVRSEDITKHKNDVFRLFSLLNPAEKIATSGNVRVNIERFLNEVVTEPVNKDFLLGGRTKEETLDILRDIYL